MLVCIFDQMEQCTDEEVARMLPFVSEQRRNQALQYRHTFGRFACLKTYLMLCGMLEKENLVFIHTEHGKPQLYDYPEIHFNISHCRNGLAVVTDNAPVGIDIEAYRPFSRTLLERCMDQTEAECVRKAAFPEQAFAAIWTRKEAVLKLRGTGLIGNLHQVLHGPEHTATRLCDAKRYACSVSSLQVFSGKPEIIFGK